MARILLIEDEAHLAQAVQRGLREEKHAVDVIAGGDDGLAAVETDVYDLVVLDLMLPGRDGIDICRQARARGRRVPIGDLELANQVKLLRFLQDKVVHPVGGKTTRAADVRVVAATNRRLDELVKRGEFREDLLHRFAPPLQVPPLRERREEIVPHARRWLRAKARQAGLPVPRFSADAEEFLLSYPWRGNVRQLEAVVSHAALLADTDEVSKALVESLVPPAEPVEARPTTWPEWKRWRDAREKEWLQGILDAKAGSRASVAEAIDMPLSSLRHLLKRHGL